MSSSCRFALCFLVLSISAGCSGKVSTYRVTGKVKLADGTPLKDGRLVFKSTDKSISVSSMGAIQPDGSYELGTYKERDGAVAGPNQVAITPTDPRLIDAKYQSLATSGLEFEVKKESNTFDITVNPPPPPPEKPKTRGRLR